MLTSANICSLQTKIYCIYNFFIKMLIHKKQSCHCSDMFLGLGKNRTMSINKSDTLISYDSWVN